MDEENLEREAVKILFSAQAKPEEKVLHTEPSGPEITFVCPFCNEAYLVSEQLSGKKITCRNCREPSRVDARKTPPPEFHAQSFWLGLILGVVLMVLGVLLAVFAMIVLKIANLI